MSKNFIRDYLSEIAQYPLLTHEEELSLGKAIKEGTPDEAVAARDKLATSNLKLVVFVAKNYKNTHLPLEDLIMEGNLGLMKAVDKYDYTLGYKFSTCAIPWIKQAILKSITEKGKTIRLPAHIYSQLNKMRDAVDELNAQGNHNPTDADIAKFMNVDVEDIANLKEWRKDAINLSTPLGDEDKNTIEDVVEDKHDESPVEYAEKSIMHDRVRDMLKNYKERTQIIMKMRYGLGDEGDPEEFFQEHTLEDIGQYIGITRERVRQIEKETLQDMKNNWDRQSLFVCGTTQ